MIFFLGSSTINYGKRLLVHTCMGFEEGIKSSFCFIQTGSQSEKKLRRRQSPWLNSLPRCLPMLYFPIQRKTNKKWLRQKRRFASYSAQLRPCLAEKLTIETSQVSLGCCRVIWINFDQ